MADVIIEYESQGADRTIGDLQKLQAAFDSTAKGTTQLARSLNTSFKSAQEFAKNLGITTQRAAQAVQRIRELNTTNANSAQKYRTLNKELGISRQEFLKLDKAVSTQAQRLKDLERQQRVATEGYRNLGLAAGAVSAAVATAFTQSTRTFLEFSNAIKQVGAISGELGTEQFAELSDEVERLGIVTSKAPADIAVTARELARAGFSAEEITEALEGVVRASEATGESLATVGEITSQTLRVFGLAAEESNNVADVLVATANNSNTNIAALGESLSFVGAQAAAANQPLDDILILLGLLADGGIKGSRAGTQLGAALERLKAASAGAESEFSALVRGNEKAVQAFNLISTEVRNSDGSMRSLLEILPSLQDGLSELSQADQDLVFKALFGVQGGRAVQTIIGSTATQVDALTDSVRNAEGVAKETSEILLQDLGGALQLLGGSLQTLATQFGEFGATFLEPIVSQSVRVINAFLKLPEPIKQVTFAIVGLTGALAGVVAAYAAYIAFNVKANAALAFQAATQLKVAAATTANTIALKAQNIALAVTAANARAAAIALAPLAAQFALVGAAVGALAFGKVANDLRNANEAFDEVEGSANQSADEVISRAQKTANAVRDLNEAREEGRDATQDEIDQAQRLIQANNLFLKNAQDQLELAKSLPAANESQRNSRDALVASIERSIQSLETQNTRLQESIDLQGDESNSIAQNTQDLEKLAEAREKAFEQQSQQRQDDFSDQQRNADRAFQRSQQADEERFNESQNAERERVEESIRSREEALQSRLNDEQERFNEAQAQNAENLQAKLQAQEEQFTARQDSQREALENRLQSRREAAEARFAEEQEGIDRQIQLEFADSDDERDRLRQRFAEEDEIAARREELEADLNRERAALEEEERQSREQLEAQQAAEREAFEQRIADVKEEREAQLQANREAFEASLNEERLALEQQVAAEREALEQRQRDEERAFQDQQLAERDTFEASQRDIQRAFQASQQELEAAFRDEQRAKDVAAAQEQKDILESTNVGGVNAATPTPLRTGGPMKAGQPYLVGDGPGGRVTPYSEIVVPGAPSYVMARSKLNEYVNNGSRVAGLSSSTLSTVAKRSGRNDPLLKAIQNMPKAVAAELAKQPQVNVSKLSMPQYYHVERGERQIAKVVGDSQRDFLRSFSRIGE